MSMMNPYVDHLENKPKEEFYFYKGNVYKKIDEITTKNPVTREWEPYVLYQNKEGQLFSREISEFYSLFSEMKDAQQFISNFKITQSLKR